MRLLSVALEGFMPYRQRQEVCFRDKNIFALVGPTGSGKSALLDAVTFAFFGKTPRWQDGRPGKELISQGQSKLCVEVEFQVGGSTYQVIRTARRSGGTDAQLRHLVGDEYKPISKERRTSTQVTSDLVSLLRMDYPTFTKTLMLPQGQFDRLLKPKEPKDRKELLIQLAGLSVYDRISDRVGDKLKVLEAGLREHEGAIAQYRDLDASTVVTLEKQAEQLAARLEQLSRLADQVGQRVQQLAADLKLQQELEHQQQQLSRLREQQAEIEALERQVRTADQLEVQRARLDHFDQRSSEWQRQNKQLEESGQLIQTYQNQLEKLRESLVEAQAAAEKLPELEQQRTLLVRAQESLTAYQQLLEERKSLQNEALSRQASTLESHSQELSASLVELRSRLDELENTEKQLGSDSRTARWQSALDAYEAWDKCRAAQEKVSAQQASLQQELAECAQRRADSASALHQAETELEQARAELESLKTELTSQVLREKLEIGCPCPVCLQPVGALPQPSAAEQSTLRQAEKNWRQAEQRAKQCRDEFQKHESAFDSAQVQQAMLARQLQEASLSTNEAHELLRSRCPEDLTRAQLQQRLAAARAEDEQRAALRSQLQEARQEHNRLETQIQVTRTRADEVRKQLERETERAGQLARRIDEREGELRQTLGVQDDFVQVAVRRLEAVQEQITTTSARLREAEQQEQQTRNRLDSETRTYELREQALKELGEQLSRLEETLHEAVRQAGLSTLEELRCSLLSPEQRQALQQQIEAHTHQTRCVEQRSQELQELLAERHPQLEELLAAERQQAEIQAERNETVRQQGSIEEQIRQTKAQLARAEEVRRAHQQAERQVNLHRKLFQMVHAGGLKAFVANQLLAEILRLASSELERLSGGRYQLEAQQDDIVVVDGWNAGAARDVRSLSGGETFLASLSLALAMVEYLSQGSPLESLFIDEGFGTLDPETLEAVTQTLESLQAKGRLVGVITHVAELAERLPVQIRVQKAQGSSKIVVE